MENLFREVICSDPLEAEPALTLMRTDRSEDRGCPLCEFFFKLVPERDGEACDAISIFRYRTASRNGSTNKFPNNPKVEIRTALSIQPRGHRLIRQEDPRVNYSRSPDTATLIDKDQVDYKALMTWIEKIQGQPRMEAKETPPVRLIDCHTRSIITVRGPLDYVALSYVWGPVAQDSGLQRNTLPVRLPLTVEDAMTVVEKLGLRYLWVDRYCLDQADQVEFQAQLNLMADIYRHALVTIIGAAGSHADYGLPGVSSRSRVHQPRIRIGDYTLWSSMSDPRHVVKRSAWMTRAWTHQEAVFSWNWLAFTDEQVFFQQSNREWANLERWWKVSSEMFPNGGLGPDANCELLQMFDNIWKNEAAVHILLGQYTARKLTYQSDALNGALGLLKRCGNGPYPTCHYFGIPLLGPIISHRKAMGRDSGRSWSLTKAFLTSLCWTLHGSGSRRVGFPSWSWTGWQGTYRSPTWSLVCNSFSCNSLDPVKIKVQFEGATIEWEEMCLNRTWNLYEDVTLLPQELSIEAPTIRLTICQDPRASQGNGHGHAAKSTPMKWCSLFSALDCTILVEVDIIDAAVEAEIVRSGKVGLTAILLHQIDLDQAKESRERGVEDTWAYALLVREDGDGTTTRVGSLELAPNNYHVAWDRDIGHTAAKADRRWVKNELIDYMDCVECREMVLKTLVKDKADAVTRVS